MTEIGDDDLDTMVNIVPNDSALPMTVWVRPRSNERHGPRIQVCTVYGPKMFPRDTVTVTLPADLRAVIAWINLNEAAIVAFWESGISGVEFGRRLQRLP